MHPLLFDLPVRTRASRYRARLHALLAKLRREAQRVHGTEQLQRVENYANGSRRLTLGLADPTRHHQWPHLRDVVEHALGLALTINHLGVPARGLRSHGGRIGHRRVQCWEIPAPHGPAVLASLVEILPVLDLPATIVSD